MIYLRKRRRQWHSWKFRATTPIHTIWKNTELSWIFVYKHRQENHLLSLSLFWSWRNSVFSLTSISSMLLYLQSFILLPYYLFSHRLIIVSYFMKTCMHNIHIKDWLKRNSSHYKGIKLYILQWTFWPLRMRPMCHLEMLDTCHPVTWCHMPENQRHKVKKLLIKSGRWSQNPYLHYFLWKIYVRPTQFRPTWDFSIRKWLCCLRTSIQESMITE